MLDISGATSQTYTVVLTDVNNQIRLSAYYVNNVNVVQFVTSQSIINILSGSVAITGNLLQGQTLTATITDANGSSGITGIIYQWEQSIDGITWINIALGTNSTLILSATQVNNYLRVLVTYTNTVSSTTYTQNIISTLTNLVHSGVVAITGTLSNGVNWINILDATASTFTIGGNIL